MPALGTCPLSRDNELTHSDKLIKKQAFHSLEVLTAVKHFVKQYKMMSRSRDQNIKMIAFKPMMDTIISHIKSTGRHPAMSLKRLHFQAQLFHGINACDSSGLRPQIGFLVMDRRDGKAGKSIGATGVAGGLWV